MNRSIYIITFLIIMQSMVGMAWSQPVFNLGLKGGVNNSKIDFNLKNYTSESVVKGHFGMFARAGLGRFFLQPEAYFSAKGGDLSSNVYQSLKSFDYKTFDVPVLVGFKLINGQAKHLHLLAGPTFNFLTSGAIPGEVTREHFSDNYVGLQYGLGVDLWFLTVSARMEHALDNIYEHPSFSGKNSSFMISLGIKIL